MRYIYSIVFYLLSPLFFLYLKKRAKKNPDYNLFWSERFAFKLKNNIAKPIIWIHAVSVGETRAMAKLVELLETYYPNFAILITQMTPTGRNTAKNLFPNAHLRYIPYDLPHGVINFYNTFKPKLGLIMETEIWPNLIHYAKQFNIPLYLVNARLSDKSFEKYNKIKFIITRILNKFTGILSQDESTLDKFKKLGYVNFGQVIGSFKFDNMVDSYKNINKVNFLKQKIPAKKIIIFASTRDGEEQQILANIPDNFPGLILIVPRHPERFDEVERLLIEKKLKYQKRSDNDKVINFDTQVFLGDSMGEMQFYYALSDLAVIGGSFSDFGSQNLLEPLQMDIPVIIGPSIYNFAKISVDAVSYGCVIQVKTILECFKIIDELFFSEDNTRYLTLKNNARNFIESYKGASQIAFTIIKKHL